MSSTNRSQTSPWLSSLTDRIFYDTQKALGRKKRSRFAPEFLSHQRSSHPQATRFWEQVTRDLKENGSPEPSAQETPKTDSTSPSTNIWERIEHSVTDPAGFPTAIDQYESQEIPRGSFSQMVLRNPESNRYLQITTKDFDAYQMMDGETSIADLDQAFHEKHGRKHISMYMLVRKLAENTFLKWRPGNVFQKVSEELQARHPFNRFASLFLRESNLRGTDRFFAFAYSLLKPIYSIWFQVPSAFLILFGLGAFCHILAQGNFSFLQFRGYYSLGILSLFALQALVTFFHECGHAITLKHYNRKADEVGVRWSLPFPTFFINSNDLLMETRKNARIAVSWGGPWVELMFAGTCSVAILIFPELPGGDILFKTACICYLMFFINMSPVGLGDGYYMLSDYLEQSNLASLAPMIPLRLFHNLPRFRELKREQKNYFIFNLLTRIWWGILTAVAIIIGWAVLRMFLDLWGSGNWATRTVLVGVGIAFGLPIAHSLSMLALQQIQKIQHWIRIRGLHENTSFLALTNLIFCILTPLVCLLLEAWNPRLGILMALVFFVAAIGVLFWKAITYQRLIKGSARSNLFQFVLLLLSFTTLSYGLLLGTGVRFFSLSSTTLFSLCALTSCCLLGSILLHLFLRLERYRIDSSSKLAILGSIFLPGFAAPFASSLLFNPDIILLSPYETSAILLTFILTASSAPFGFLFLSSNPHPRSRFASLLAILAFLPLIFLPFLTTAPSHWATTQLPYLLGALLLASAAYWAVFSSYSISVPALATTSIDQGTDRDRLEHSFEHLAELTLEIYADLYGPEKLEHLAEEVNRRSIEEATDIYISGKRIRRNYPEEIWLGDMALRYRSFLGSIVDHLTTEIGQPIAERIISRIHDQFPWQTREIISHYIFIDRQWDKEFVTLLENKRTTPLDIFLELEPNFRDLLDSALVPRSGMNVIQLQPHEILFRQDDPANTFYYILRGAIDIYDEVDDGERFITRYTHGLTLGESALVPGRSRRHSARTATTTQLMSFGNSTLDAIQKMLGSRADEFVRQRILGTFLKHVPLFAPLSWQEIALLQERFEERVYEPGKTILDTGDPVLGLYLVQIGRVEVYGEDPGVQLTTHEQTEYFGAGALLQQRPSPLRYAALDEVTILFLPAHSFKSLVLNYLKLQDRIEKYTSRRAQLDIFDRLPVGLNPTPATPH